MLEFIKNVFKAGTPESSKRVVAGIALLLYVAIVICNLAGIQVDEKIIYGTLSLICVSLGMTLITPGSPTK
jgi:F0F1-type ATP synthase membrane subunit a